MLFPSALASSSTEPPSFLGRRRYMYSHDGPFSALRIITRSNTNAHEVYLSAWTCHACIGTKENMKIAARTVQTELPDVAGIDTSMPVMDGIEATTQILLHWISVSPTPQNCQPWQDPRDPWQNPFQSVHDLWIGGCELLF